MDLGRIVLAPPERRELKRRARKRSLAVELVKRAELILMLAAGHSYREVRQRLDCSDMALNIFVMARSHCMQRSRLAPAMSWERPPLGHTSVEFVDFLGQILASQPASREIHIVADNLSAHKTKNVFEFLQAHPTVRIHYTPTYSSWLNQVDIWFSKIQRDVIARGIFTSTTDLSRNLIRYIKQHHKTATPFRWRFKNADNRIKSVTQRVPDSGH